MFPYAPGQDVFGGSVGGGSFRYFATAGLNYPAACPGSDLGELVKHFMYDGVGRLVRVSSPVDPEMVGEGYSMPSNGVNTFTHSERFFCDGTRRVQELVTDPVVVSNEDGDVPLMGDESQQGNQAVPGSQYAVSYMRAQYVWGPGDGTNGVDELLCQLDPLDTSSSSYSSGGGKPWYVLTDAQGDVVSVVHVPPGTNTSAEVGGQWTYSPYGEVLTYEQFHPHPSVVFGHKTLAVDRLDGEAMSWSATAGMYETPRLVVGARLVGYARNRTLDVKHGRWLQVDPNASGAVVVGSSNFHGSSPDTPATVSILSRVTDGVNLYQYAASSPAMREDRFGLYSLNEFGEDFFNSSFGMPGVSDFLGGALSSMVETYAANQEWDVDWAMEWAQGDDWSTRNDNSWVLESIVQGVYDSFEMGWGDYKVNPLDFVGASGGGGRNPANSPGSQNAMSKGQQNHHIATNKGSLRHEFETEFKRAGMTLDDPANLVSIPHGGRHSREYHDYVLKRVKNAVNGKSTADAKVALTAELKSLKDFVKRNPHFVYNSSGGKNTGWKGMREHFTVKRGGKYRYRGPR